MSRSYIQPPELAAPADQEAGRARDTGDDLRMWLILAWLAVLVVATGWSWSG